MNCEAWSIRQCYRGVKVAAEGLDCNKTRAVLVSCDVVGGGLDGVEDVLEHSERSPRLCQELAGTISTRQVAVDVSEPEMLAKID